MVSRRASSMNENIRIVNIEKDLQSGRKDDQFSLNFMFCVLYQVQTTELPQAPEREVKSGVGGSRHSFSLLSECSVSHVMSCHHHQTKKTVSGSPVKTWKRLLYYLVVRLVFKMIELSLIEDHVSAEVWTFCRRYCESF